MISSPRTLVFGRRVGGPYHENLVHSCIVNDCRCCSRWCDVIDHVPVDLLRALWQCRIDHHAWHGTQAARRREGREADCAPLPWTCDIALQVERKGRVECRVDRGGGPEE